MSTGIKKLQEEHKFLKKKGILATFGGTAAPIKKDYLHWFGNIEGPKNSPYEGGTFYFEMKFKDNYPARGSIVDVQMRTPTYHPNIDSLNGHICVSYMNKWKSENSIAGIVNAIFELLSDPNPESAYNTTDNQKAKNFTLLYANVDQNINWDQSWDKGWNNNPK